MIDNFVTDGFPYNPKRASNEISTISTTNCICNKIDQNFAANLFVVKASFDEMSSFEGCDEKSSPNSGDENVVFSLILFLAFRQDATHNCAIVT